MGTAKNIMKPRRGRDRLTAALRLACPACGRGRIFVSAWRMARRCPTCGLLFEREDGYFVGAMYVGMVTTSGLAIGIYAVGRLLLDLPDGILFAILLGVMIALPPLLWRHTRAIWLAIDDAIDPRPPAGGDGGRPGG